jgi:hypothetical protein
MRRFASQEIALWIETIGKDMVDRARKKLATLGFCRLESDWGLYVKPQIQEEDPILILVYVDDFVIASRTTTVIQDLLKKLKGFWKLSEMGK